MTLALAKTKITGARQAWHIRAAAGAFALLAGCTGINAESNWPDATSAIPAPTEAQLRELLNDPGPLGDRTLGNRGAPVTVIEYASLGCAICRAFHKTTFARFKADYIDTGKVYFIYREFPIGKSPAAAAAAARCVPEKDFFRINAKFMNTTAQWNAREVNRDLLYKVVQETGLSRAAFDTCMSNQKINDGVAWTKHRGRELGIQGTPTFFINGQKVRGGLTIEEMRSLIEEQLRGRTAKPV